MAEVQSGHCLTELQFARSLSSHHRVAHAGMVAPSSGQQVGEELHVLQGHDRLLVIAEAIQASNMPLLHTSMPDGPDDAGSNSSNDLQVWWAHVAWHGMALMVWCGVVSWFWYGLTTGHE